MTSEKDNTQQKLFYIKTYPNLLQIETVIRTIVQKNSLHLQLSVLGKLSINKPITKKELDNRINIIKRQLGSALGRHFKFDHFHNPEVGFLFIAGSLTPTFLNKIDGRALASLPSGLYGIFRGLGIDYDDIDNYLAELKEENYFLIIRGNSESFTTVESFINAN